jgi:hypothetical protein
VPGKPWHLFLIGTGMSNLRIIYNNIADTANIVASSTAAGFSVTNLKTTQKTSVHRSIGNTVTYTLNWATTQRISAVALPATNLVGAATIRVQLYAESTDTEVIGDTGILTACKGRVVSLQGNITQPTYKDFGFGGATKTSVWLNRIYSVKKIVISLTNEAPIDCARIVCGTYWESSRQASNGISIEFSDSSEVTTTRSGNTYVDRKTISDSINLSLEYIDDVDRQELLKLMRSWGSNGLLYLCVFPDNTNPELTQSYSIYGRSQNNSVQYRLFSLYDTSLTINSW